MLFPRTIEEVAAFMRLRLPYFVLGSGSNLIVRDGGIAGVVLHLKHFRQIVRSSPDMLVAGAGVLYPRLSVHAEKAGLAGLEFAAGIPGTVGGAVAMNAGIPDHETAAVLKEVTIVDPAGKVASHKMEKIHFGYRSSQLPAGVVVSASFGLTPASSEALEVERERLLAARRKSQPLSLPNVGSVFKNPPGDFAGRLIEKVGLKGERVGEAQISPRHANFIVNLGKATARDVIALIRVVGQRVEQECGVTLELEAKIVGRALETPRGE
jgi:UDP-N-acetylmuramate dehydrogenase